MSEQRASLTRRVRRNPAATEISFLLGDQPHCLDARDAVHVPFELSVPVRQFPSWPGKKNYSGLHWSITTRRHIPFESLYERAALLVLDQDPSVVAIASQPMWINWPDATGSRNHAPDFFVRHANGDGEVIDVRPKELIDPRTAEVFSATRTLCETLELRYRVVDDLDPMITRNLSFLSRYAAEAWLLPPELMMRLSSLACAVTIREMADLLGERPLSLGWVYSLLWHRAIDADLRHPLGLGTLVFSTERGSH